MSSPYRTTNGNQVSDHADVESKSSVNIATEILEAQRIVTRRLQQRREKEKNQRQKIYETTKDNIVSGDQSVEGNTTTTTTTTTTYNTQLEKGYSPLSYRKPTLIVGHSNNNSSDDDNDDDTKIDESFSYTEEINMPTTSRLKDNTEINRSNADDEVEEMNYYKTNKFNINNSHSTPSSYRKIYPSIPNSVPKSNTYLKLSKEETLVNDDNRKEPSISKYNNQNIGLNYQPNHNGHVRIRRKTSPSSKQNIQNNDDYLIEEDDLYKDNPYLYYVIYPLKQIMKLSSLGLYALYQLVSSKPFILLLLFSIAYCAIDSRYINSVVSEAKYLSGIRSITTRSEYWKSLWDHVRSPFSASPIQSSPPPIFNGNTETYNKIINNLNTRLDLIQSQINVLSEKTEFLVKDSKELSKDFNKVKHSEMFTKFKDDLEQISQEINNIQDSYKEHLNSLFDKKFSPNNEKLIKFEREIGDMKKLLDNYKAEIGKISNIQMNEADFKKLQKEVNNMNDRITQLDKKASLTSSKDTEKINENEKKLSKIHTDLTSLFNKFKEMKNQLESGDGAKSKQFDSIHKLFEQANERLTEVEGKMNKLNIDRLLSFEESDQQQNIVNYIDLHNRQKEDHEQLVDMKNKWDNFQSGYSQTEKDLSYISSVLKKLSENQEKLSREYDELVETFPDQVADITEKTFRKDFVGLPDFALESGGARVISKLTSETYRLQPEGFVGTLSKLLGIAIKPGRPPTEAIQPAVHAGECWAMRGSSGVLTLKLAKSIIPTQITLEHLAKEISFSISSAPRFVEIYAIHDIKAFSAEYIANNRDLVGSEKPYATLIGKVEYDPAKKSLQTFDLQTLLPDPIQYLQIQFLENWGHPDYTCIYRVRVHGTPVAMPTQNKEGPVETEKPLNG
jgi:SUN domain-containing protein 1/2